MLTPVFQLDQDDRFLVVRIRAPHCKLADAELSYEGNVFLFLARPYFLRLFLPASVVDDESGTCAYDSEQGQFTVHVPKKCRGEHFPRLEMLSELLKPQQRVPDARRLVEVVGQGKGEEEGRKRTKLFMEQQLNQFGEQEAQIPGVSSQFGYGFGWTRHGILGRFEEEVADLIDLEDAEMVPIEERADKLREFDEKHFQEQHYLADLLSPEELQMEAMAFVLSEEHLKMDEEDRAELKDLKIRQLEQFSPENVEHIGLSLIDLLFAFHYDLRTTTGEHNVESGWTISRLAPSLSFLLRWADMRETVLAIVRHSLVLPLVRNWDLALKVLWDVHRTLKAGPPAILHCLLSSRRIFNRGDEFRYLFNQLFLDDFCLWIQTVPEELLSKLRTDLKREIRALRKADLLELDLEFIEAQARMEMMRPLDSDDEPEVAEMKRD